MKLKTLVRADVPLRIALLHHPVFNVGATGYPIYDWLRGQTGGFAFDLRDRDRVGEELDTLGVQVVLCGHEHRLANPLTNVLHRNGRILQLAASTPTLPGGKPSPSVSLYGINIVDEEDIRLGWAVYRIDSDKFANCGVYRYDGTTWHRVHPPSGAPIDPTLFPGPIVHRMRPPRPRP